MNIDSPQVREKHRSLYFVDGNVVILALRHDGRSEVLFRVHKSVLSIHSPVFSDMFDVFNGLRRTDEGEANELYDGVPLVSLSDNADHLGVVFGVLYYQSDLPYVPRTPDYPRLIGPILEIARKYGIDRMYAQIVKYLESDWPKTLEDWDRTEDAAQSVPISNGPIDHRSPEPAAAIMIARQFDIPRILPAAFYHLSRLSILDDREKTLADPSIHIRSPTKRTARWELLSAEDLRCLLLGKEELAEFLRRSVDPKDLRHSVNDPSAFGPQPCIKGEKAWNIVLSGCLQSGDPLKFLQIEGIKSRDCSTCSRALKDKIKVVREQIWEKLGEFFHLEVQ